jgi:hypothetical protein
MPVKTACPACQMPYTLADTMRGKNVRCKQCQAVFAVTDAAGLAIQAEAAPPARPARARGAATPPPLSPADPRTGPLPRRRREPAGDDGTGSNALLWILLASGGGVLLIAGIVVTIILMARSADEGPVPAVAADPVVQVPPPGGWQQPVQPGGPVPGFPNPGGQGPAPLQAASTRIPLEVSSNQIDDVFFAPAARQVACYYRTKDIFDKQLAFYDTQTRQRTALLDLGKDVTAGYVDVSPDASRVARILSVPGQGSALNVWSLPDGKPVYEKWNPYPKDQDPKRAFKNLTRELLWCAFLDRDRLLTVARNGQYDLWDMTQRKGIYTFPAAPGRPGILEHDHFANRPRNLALSHDRKILALSNKNGFDLIDTATGRRLRSTPPLNVKGKPGNEWSVAFSPDGAQLAAKMNLFEADNRQHEYVFVWDVATGQQKAMWPMEQNFNANGPMVWWGPRHVLLNNGIRTEGHLLSLTDGRFRCVLQRNGFGKWGGNSPDGQLWCATAPGAIQLTEISATAAPEEHLRQLPPGGPGQPLPRWYVGPEGVFAQLGR